MTFITQAQSLADYKWKNRLLILVDKTMETNALLAQHKRLLAKENELTERDILIFLLTPEGLKFPTRKGRTKPAADIYKKLSITPAFSGIILVGKDGGIKLKQDFEVQPETVFTLIDGMPMRKSEIKSKKGS